MPAYLGSDELDAVYLGSTLVDAFYLGADLLWPLGGGPTPPTVVGFVTTTVTVSTAAFTFPGSYTPQENDLVLSLPSSQSTMAVAADSAGWINVLGSGNEHNAGAACGMAALYRWVTAADESGVNRTYNPFALLGAENGDHHAYAIRGANLTTPIDAYATALGATAVTPHTVPGLPGASLSSGSLVIATVAKDGSGVYSSTPAAYGSAWQSNTIQGRWSGEHDNATTAGVDVTAYTVTPSSADEYVAMTIAIAAA